MFELRICLHVSLIRTENTTGKIESKSKTFTTYLDHKSIRMRAEEAQKKK